MQGLSAPAAWGRLQELLQQAGRQGGAPELRLAVVEAALARDPTIKLPPWLLAAHQVSPQKRGSSGSGAWSHQPCLMYLRIGLCSARLGQQGLDTDYLLLPVTPELGSPSCLHAHPPLIAVQGTDQADGMAAAGARPADLLRILVSHRALESAAELAVHHLDLWSQVGGLQQLHCLRCHTFSNFPGMAHSGSPLPSP